MSAPDGVSPVLQLTRDGASWHDRERSLPRLRDEFRRRHCVRLPAFLEPHLLARIRRGVDRGAFRDHAHGSAAFELCLEPDASVGLLHFLVNDPHVYGLIEELSECRPTRCFAGRVYRHLPNGPHYHEWHGDLAQDRQVGMSINLSAAVYEGGVFEIRDRDTRNAFASIANVGFGDAILFRLADTLEHRVTAVRGAFPKTAFAGWFRPSPDYRAALRRDPFLTSLPHQGDRV